jgi:redox-sensitive bicupin YhaK (pirin superfamily)
MLVLRPSSQRGGFNHDWLNSRFSFSFAEYYDPAHMGFSKLRVINDDIIQPNSGFDTHSHRDMEIISYVLEGNIAHKDSQGNVKTLPAGEFQLMSAGSGISHSEHNHSSSEVLKLLQIWIEPKVKGQTPGYQQKDFGQGQGLTHIISPDGISGTLQIKQDMHLHQLILDPNQQVELSHSLPNQYIHLVTGKLSVNGQVMTAGDGLKISDEPSINFKALEGEPVKALVFELP